MNGKKIMYWHNGIFLKPHHFQYMQLNAQNTAKNFNQLNSKHHWGVINLKIDESGLNNYELSIKSGAFLFKDGTIVDYPDNALLSTRDFSKFIKGKESLKCYLGVKKLSKSKSNVTTISNEESPKKITTRFVFDDQKTNPENNLYEDEDEIDIPYLNLYLRIFFEDEIDLVANYELLPLAIIDDKKGNIRLSKTYSPALINLFADNNLSNILDDIYNHLFAYIGRLEEYKISINNQSSNGHIQKKIMVLYALSEFIPILESYVSHHNIHPWEIYNTLLRLISKLSVFSSMIDARGRDFEGNLLLDGYDHNNLFQCFNDARKLIFDVLKSIDASPDLIADFEYLEDKYSVSVPERFLQADYDFYIAIRTDQMDGFLKNLQFLKIASSQRIVEIIGSSLPGLSFKQLSAPPFGLSKEESTLYLKLQTSGDEWLGICSCKDISLFYSNLTQRADMQLIAISK